MTGAYPLILAFAFLTSVEAALRYLQWWGRVHVNGDRALPTALLGLGLTQVAAAMHFAAVFIYVTEHQANVSMWLPVSVAGFAAGTIFTLIPTWRIEYRPRQRRSQMLWRLLVIAVAAVIVIHRETHR